MKLDFNNERSIYVQIAESIKDDIFNGALVAEDPVPSTNQIAVIFKINPATAGKGIGLLADSGILYKKRGIGMFVVAEARERILTERRETFGEHYIAPLVAEANRLGISTSELRAMIDREEKCHE